MNRILSFAFVLSMFSSVASAEQQAARAPVEDAPHVMPRRALDRDTIKAALVKRREHNLAEFRAYERAGVFPDNLTGKTRNVWRDDNGHLCAAANLVSLSGDTELVDRVAEQTNFIKLGEVTTGPLMDWILTSGFTQAEVAMIQEVYRPIVRKVEPQRGAENQRLHAVYQAVAAKLDKQRDVALELAVTRLMKHPDVAWRLVDAS